MTKRITHSYETKMRVIEMKLEGHSNRSIQESLGLKHVTQVETWWRWYRSGELHRFHQPLGKQYAYGKGPEGRTPEETLEIQNKSLKQQIKLLKKYLDMERKWYQR